MMRKILAAVVSAVLFAATTCSAFAVDCSGTVGTSATPLFNTSSVRGFVIMNNSLNLMCLSFDAPAATGGLNCPVGSYALPAASATTQGGSFTSPPNFNPTTASIIAAGAASNYSCTRW